MKRMDEGQFQIRVTRLGRRKKNSVEYRLETVAEIFDLLTEKNIARFMREFKSGMRAAIAMREVTTAIAVAEGLPASSGGISMPAFIWVDD